MPRQACAFVRTYDIALYVFATPDSPYLQWLYTAEQNDTYARHLDRFAARARS